MLAALVLGIAEQAHRTVGPRAAIGVLRTAAESEVDPQARRTLLLRALGIAALSEDRESFASTANRWAGADGEGAERRGLSLVARLHGQGRSSFAATLAEAEAARFRSADSVFALAAVSEREGRADLSERLLLESASLGARASDPVSVARAERELLRFAPPGVREREAVAAFEAASPRDAPRFAGAALRAPGLYARVRVLDRLLDLAGDRALGALAGRLAIAHADAHGPRLTALERDRVVAVGDRLALGPELIAALRGGEPPREALRARARSALAGNLLGPEPDEPGARRDWRGLAVLAALARDEAGAARAPLATLRASAPSAIAWTAAMRALSSTRTQVEAVACIEAWLAEGVPPPRGYAALVPLLDGAGQPELAERALGQAVRAHEPSARLALSRRLERRARAAYDAGELVEARALSVRAIALE